MIGQLRYALSIGTHIVVFVLVKLEHGRVPVGQLFVSLLGLVTLTNGVPVASPQMRVPLNYPILIGCIGLTLIHPYFV